jgi:hypothetical protein
MHVSRPADDECIVPLKNERTAFLGPFRYIQNHTHRIVLPGSLRRFGRLSYPTPRACRQKTERLL